MIPISGRLLHAVAAVVDVALHARPTPVSAKALAARHELPPRYLEPVLQALVRNGILKGVRGPRGGYELGRDRRHISVGDIIRAVAGEEQAGGRSDVGSGRLIATVVVPALAEAGEEFGRALDRVTVEDLWRAARPNHDYGASDFTI